MNIWEMTQESRTQSGLTKKIDASVFIYVFWGIVLNTLLVYKLIYFRSKHAKTLKTVVFLIILYFNHFCTSLFCTRLWLLCSSNASTISGT